MRTDEIRFVTEVYRTGSMARAARNLNITPQGLGKAIQKLEKELGIKLFTRTFEGVLPTAACNQIFDRLTDIVNAEDEIREIVRQYATSESDEEVFLIGPNTVGFMVEEAILSYNKRYGKNIRVLESNLRDDIQEQAFLENKYAYRYCCAEDVKNNFLLREELIKFRYLLFVGKGSPLERKESVTYEDLSEMTLLVEDMTFPHVRVLQKKFEEHNVKCPKIKCVTINTEMICLRLSSDPTAVYFARSRDRLRYSQCHIINFQPEFYTTLCLETHNKTINRELLSELRKKLANYNS